MGEILSIEKFVNYKNPSLNWKCTCSNFSWTASWTLQSQLKSHFKATITMIQRTITHLWSMFSLSRPTESQPCVFFRICATIWLMPQRGGRGRFSSSVFFLPSHEMWRGGGGSGSGLQIEMWCAWGEKKMKLIGRRIVCCRRGLFIMWEAAATANVLYV